VLQTISRLLKDKKIPRRSKSVRERSGCIYQLTIPLWPSHSGQNPLKRKILPLSDSPCRFVHYTGNRKTSTPKQQSETPLPMLMTALVRASAETVEKCLISD
ncbi:MAG: hypothetical protein WBC73_12385, partial [Phormidesmis sp.]